MKLRNVSVKNFKALDEVSLSLQDFNVIVGPNGSGKSSVLQALHWIIQSARNPSVDTNKDPESGSTLSLNDAIYMPSPDYKNAGHDGIYGNFKDAKRLDVTLRAEEEDEGGDKLEAKLWLKAARNEGLSVHVPSNNQLSAALRDRNREFSAYIPGLAGIPLSEERRAKSIVLRQAAAGDANTVLRNVLWLLKQIEVNSNNNERPLSELQDRVSKAIRKTEFKISFDDDKDYSISVEFKTSEMADWRSLELAGIGFLQAIQIFAYIVLFNPRLLLIDEPDSHLHPDAQGRLVREIAQAAHDHGCQVIMTTHSPSVVRALPDGTRVIWMRDGKAVGKEADARKQMGWGLLDKELVLLTEDKETDMLRALLSQWPDLERRIAIWPLEGSGNLPKGVVLNGLQSLFGNVKTLMHRDGDMMLAPEKEFWREKWGLKPHQLWFTEGADIESYFVCPKYCAAVLQENQNSVQEDIFDHLIASESDKDFVKKREDARELYPTGSSIPSNSEAFSNLRARGYGHVRKKAVSPLRARIQNYYKGGREQPIGKVIPQGIELAQDLKSAIEAALSNK